MDGAALVAELAKRAGDKSHHVGRRRSSFTNPWPSYVDHGLPSVVKMFWQFDRKRSKPQEVPRQDPDWSAMTLAADAAPALPTTWLGHASFLVTLPGFRVLTDPVFSQRCSPVQWAGPKRFSQPPCAIADLPDVDVVVISHNHYDHLDAGTVKDVVKHHPKATWFVPIGNGALTRSLGVPEDQVFELDWWEHRVVQRNADGVVRVLEDEVAAASFSGAVEGGTADEKAVEKPVEGKPVEGAGGGAGAAAGAGAEAAAGAGAAVSAVVGGSPTMRVVCTPCQHFSGRGLHDRCKTLWASWTLIAKQARPADHGRNDVRVFFGGDTGYRSVPKDFPGDHTFEALADLPHCPAFADIGQVLGPFDLALLPIGAYSPRWFMSPIHTSPLDAVELHRDIRSKTSLGMHWGTWVLTDEPVLDPPRMLAAALDAAGMAPDAFTAMAVGETRVVPLSPDGDAPAAAPRDTVAEAKE